MARPDLSNPEARKAYRAELLRVARGWRWTGLALVTLSAIGIVQLARLDLPWSSTLGIAVIAALVIGWGIAGVGMVKRTRYHKARMAEPA